MGSPPWFTRSVEAVGAEEYGLFLDGLPQRSARPLSDRYACWQERCVLPSWLDTTLRWGHPIQFKRRPLPFMGLVETTLRDPAASTALAAEVARLLVKGAITVVPPYESHLGFYSRYFLVSKKSGEKRPILDLRVFNRFVSTRKFRMLTVGALFRCVREGDWFTSLDLKDAYFHVPVRQAHRKFLRFVFMGMAYEYQCLPFGNSLAPRTFSKCVETALEPLRRQGKRILFYLDDLLILSNSEETARRDTMLVINHLSFLGFAINWEKSSTLPSRQTVYLGLCLDSATMTVMLSPPRRDAILSALSRFHVRRNVTALSTMRLLGLMAAAHPVVPLGLLFTTPAVVCSPTVGPQATQAQGAPRSPFGVARPGILERTLRPSQGCSPGQGGVLCSGLHGHLVDGLGRNVPLSLGRRRVAHAPYSTHKCGGA
ncbi:uncharacterized protein LOC132446441 [Gadus macrocephalus]|uniref:uncharacterized protein LOC132446441 n=1 Tax=Gadus macrocephalus TaxID=80720 RepID=UPI0028CB2F76|nr:uncharacterized protein LOC132446441 [Gadus macrocephalus]